MNDKKNSAAHWSFWLVTTFMLIWNVMGCINFFVQMNPEMLASYQETEQSIIQGRPFWATAAFAIAVFAGSFGCILLMLKKSAAFYLFVASLVGVVVTTLHTMSIGISFGIGELIGVVLMPGVVAVFLIWYSKYVVSKGWISS